MHFKNIDGLLIIVKSISTFLFDPISNIPRVILLVINGGVMPQINRKLLIENPISLTKLQLKNRFFLVSIQKVHNSVSLFPHLYKI
jgi:hypothetical protein